MKQGNYCVSLLRKTWKNVLCKKDVLRNFAKFTGKHLCQSFLFSKVAKVLITFFSNVVSNFNISRFPDSDTLIQNIKDPTLKAILKYRKHPSIIASESKYRNASSSSFVEANEADVEKEIFNKNGNKTSQNSDMPTKVIKENLDIFSRFLCTSFNS